MKNKTSYIAVALCAAAGLWASSTVVFASEDSNDSQMRPMMGMGKGMGMGMGMHHGRGHGAAMRFQAIDQNNDGIINDDEAAANAESVFTAMDADDDGSLTETEFMSVRMGPGMGRNKARMQARQEQKRARFPAMDADNNKTVSKAEFMQAAQKRFTEADTNNDGMVTPWEFRSRHRVF